jgi:serine/threonine protein kinase
MIIFAYHCRENGLEHGGISSKNIVLDVDLNARLIDFKLSKDINDIASSPSSFRLPSAGEVDQANHDSKCDDTATCGVKDFADFRRGFK